ncbi:MAG: hypothetical protein MUP02_05825 [Actinobacteria bacterium]|nr:hypothetical protein [Actinomycetota bacterium]
MAEETVSDKLLVGIVIAPLEPFKEVTPELLINPVVLLYIIPVPAEFSLLTFK